MKKFLSSTIALVLATTGVEAGNEDELNILEVPRTVIGETGEFSTLIGAVLHAEPTDEFDFNRHCTVFAQNDAAFADLDLNAGNFTDLPGEDVAATRAGRRRAATYTDSLQTCAHSP